ncbi:Hypothetical protein, putative [Bodo saltans]|uniref:Uncharacterized protein n=1 Tax=Bodo saltans TaxID=75058 RepID=A0A0S4IW04_BODSA|nr:Hypothetical protein, putative [Bodo saltans]|eukprot:CUG05874.1 Hypothetical protein, putative [Bodo saltans]
MHLPLSHVKSCGLRRLPLKRLRGWCHLSSFQAVSCGLRSCAHCCRLPHRPPQAASSATSHRHLKQTVLSADTLNATALGCLDQLFVAMPDLRTVLSNSRTRARAGVGSVGSLNQHRALGGTSHAPTANVALDPQPPTETLRSLWRSLKFAHAAEAAHDQMCFHGSPPSALMLSSQVGVKRSVNKHSNMAVLKAFYESFSDIVEHLDKVPRMHLPKILRLISLVWNYEGVSPVATASKLERYITNALQPTRRSRRGTNASPVVSSATIVSGVFNDSTAPHSGGASATSSSLITVDSVSVIPVLSSSWFFSAKEKSFEPPAFLLATTVTNAHGEVTVPKGYVLSNGSEGVGLYWDTGRGGSGSQLESEQNMLVAGAMEFVGGALRWWLPRSSEVRRWVVENSSLSPTTRSTVLAAAQALLPPLRRGANAFPFLPDPVGMMRVGGRPVPIFPAHLGWDSPDSLLLRLQCIGDAKRIQPQDADRIVGYLRHLRDKNWYVPAVRTVVALAIAALVTSSPENFLGPASLLLASCRSAAVLHTLEAVHVYDGLRLENQSKSTASCAHEPPVVTATDRKLFDAPTDDTLVQRATANELQQHFTTNNAPSTYAVLLSSVVHHVLVNEAPSRIIASLPVLTHAFEYGDSVLPNKAALLDQLAVRVPELPNSWYCGHHVVTCCRVFLVSEIRRLLGTVTATTSSETILMTTAAQVLLDVILRRFSDLAVAQTAAMIRNVIGHLPLDTVGALLDVSADDVQEVLTVCERPQASRTHDASGAQHTTISIRQSVDKSESSSAATKLPLRANEIEIPIVLEWAAPSRALGSTEDLSNLSPLQLAQCEPLVGGAVELYAEAPSGWVQQKGSRGNFGAPATTSMTTTTQQQPPLHVVPITLLNEHHSTTTCVLRLEVSVCATVALFPLYRAPSGYCAPLGGSDTPQALTIPFRLFTRNAKFAPFATTPRPDSLDSESLIQLDDADVDMRSVLCDVFGIATTTSTSGSSQGDGNLCVVLDIVPQQSARVEYDAGSLLVTIAASNPNCLMFVEELLLARLSKQWS